MGRLAWVTYPDQTVGYAYDAAGQRLSTEDPIGTTSYGYDEAGRITAVTSPQGSLYYGYDAASRRTSIQYPGSRSVTYGCDLAGRLRAITDWAGQQVAYDYDDAGRKLGQTNANGTDAAYSYDTAGRLQSITHTGPGGTIASFSYDRDSAGNPLSAQEQMSLVSGGTLGYGYDRLGRLTTVTYPGPLEVSYAYDPMGNRTQLVDAQGTSSYSYDTSDRLLLITGPQNLSFSWDPRGNQTGKGTQTFGYSGANRLTSASIGQSSATYLYNGEGVRVGKTVDSVATSYLQDQVGGLPHVVLEATGQDETLYLYGLGLALQVNPDGSRRYYHTDALGSTRVVTDDLGDAVSGFNYDVFGAVRDQAGEGRSFTFTGEQLDSETALVFLRARHYDPQTARFLGRDPYSGRPTDPRSLNRFSYANMNPLRYVDPSGNEGVDPEEILREISKWLQIGIDFLAGAAHSGSDALTLGATSGMHPPARYSDEAYRLGWSMMDAAFVAQAMRGAGGKGCGGATTIGKQAIAIPQVSGSLNRAFLMATATKGFQDLTQFFASSGKGYGSETGRVTNSVGQTHPSYSDPRTGKEIPFPEGTLSRIDVADRVEYGPTERGAFIREWLDRGYEVPRGGWNLYEVHHIRPREFGGNNDFWNLVPVEREFHIREFNEFWRRYP